MKRICPIHGGTSFVKTSGLWDDSLSVELPDDGPQTWLVCEECLAPRKRAEDGVKWASGMAQWAQTSSPAEREKWGRCLSDAVDERSAAYLQRSYAVRWDGSESLLFTGDAPVIKEEEVRSWRRKTVSEKEGILGAIRNP